MGRFLGECLLDSSALARLKPPPPSLASLFPEHEAASLDAERSRDEILGRLLRFGGRSRLRWAFAYYGRPAIRCFVREQGPASLDARTLRFWQVFFRLPHRPVRSERLKGRLWGGA